MLFSSIQFLFVFFPAVLICYFLAPRLWAKNAVLLVSSLLFYAWGELGYTWVLLASILIGWAFGLWVERDGSWLPISLGTACLLSLLVFFKYSGASHHLPLGISFFIFQALSYLLDVRRRGVAAEGSLFKFAVYKSFFPQLIAGPIVRYAEVHEQLSRRETSWADLDEGAGRFVRGLAQKVLLANVLGKAADEIFGLGLPQLSAASAWLGALCYFFQIYYDFAGYSNMAIGMGRIFGFRFPENFDHPYASLSVREFWRRWHMTLSRWFKDYVYIPLGGSRGSRARTLLNLSATFLLCGLWHGGAWTFIAWGAFHGLLQVLERLGSGSWLEKLPRLFKHAYLCLAVMLGWVLFRSPSLAAAKLFYAAMAGGAGGPQAWPVQSWLSGELCAALAAAALFSFPVRRAALAWLESRGQRWAVEILAWGLMVLGLLYSAAWLSGDSFNPFLYYRF